MTNIHLITVGLSLLLTAGARRDDPNAWRHAPHAGPFMDMGVDELTAAIRANEVPQAWAQRLRDDECAELFSLIAARRRQPDPDPPRIVLLSSDTAAGLVAAFRLAVELRIRIGQADQPIDLRDFPGEYAINAGPGVTIARVAGLSAEPANPGESGQAAFDKSVMSLAHVGRALLAFQYTSLTTHLSGGYKPTIPYLITIVEAMAALNETVRHNAIFTLDHPSINDNTIVELRLRHLPPEPYQSLAAAVTPGSSLLPPQPETIPLQGTAWLPDSPGPRRLLTEVGRALSYLVPPGTAPHA